MTFLSILARLLGWFFRDIQPPEPARVRLPERPPKCFCGHLCVLHENGSGWCSRCTCSYPEPVGPRSIP